MELYETIDKRRTIRDFEERMVPQEVLERILEAGLKAPNGNHLRDIHYVVIRGKEEIGKITAMVGVGADRQMKNVEGQADMQILRKEMYMDALPKQRQMLIDPGTLVLPFFFHAGDFNQSNGVTTYNNFASAWCGIENVMLAATAEGLACSIRIPIGEEPVYVTRLVGAPEGYVLCCYLGIGYPAKDAVKVKQNPASLTDKVHFGQW
jgi:nitroreductase